MKKYILIQNDGEIETNSFELIGASTKRNETDKIGFFGSGLKYSIAYCMRTGIEFKIYSGHQELVFTTIPETLKEQSFDRICINGKPTSYTVTMGPTWKEDWFVLREIYCNALDEGSCTLIKETEIVQPSEGKTRIFIELTESLRTVVEQWDSYFTDEREPLFTADDIYTSYLGTEDGGYISKQEVLVYKKTDGVLFRRGIRVNKSRDYIYDYGCKHININEDRTARSPGAFGYAIADMAGQISNENWLKSILRTAQDDRPCDEYFQISSYGDDAHISENWVQFSSDNLLVSKETAGKYAEEMVISKKEVFLIPSILARKIKKEQPSTVILGMGSVIGNSSMQEVSITPKMEFLLKEVKASLLEMKYQIPFDISVVEFDDENVLGMADTKQKKILIASKVFDMGRREIATTIIEETEHIKSGKEDETRAFQNHLISQWLKSMEESNGLFL